MKVVIEGLSRTGKSTLAKEIARRMDVPLHEARYTSRTHDGSDYDSYVIGKAHGYNSINWRSVDLVMDRQLPSSAAFCMFRHRNYLEKGTLSVVKEMYELDKTTPCLYVYIKWTGVLSEIEQAMIADDNSSDMTIDEIKMFRNDIESFMDMSPNQVIPVHSHWKALDRRKTTEELADEVMFAINQNRISWDDYFMTMAHLSKRRSTGLTRHVGAVLAKHNKVVGIGYNGSPSGVPHCTENRRRGMASGENLHLERTVHAEINAILNASRSVHGATLYCTTQPCGECTKALINAGIKRIVYDNDYPSDMAKDILSYTNIEVVKWE